MNLGRTGAIARREFLTSLRRPMFWIIVALLALVAWGLSQGNLTISSGNASVGGEKLWINSQFNLSLTAIFLGFLLYCFFVSVMAGLSVIQDDEHRVSELLFGTPLTGSEYVVGKLAGLAMTFGAVLTFHTASTIVFFQWLPIADAEEVRGPFELGNYLLPMLQFTAPVLIFFGATAFAIGERWRRPILVFFLPTALFLVTVFFLWNWSPPWLDPRINRLLMVLDPSGFRWLNETWLEVDRGVAFYNTSPVPLDWIFWVNRGWMMVVAALVVLPAARHCTRAVAGDLPRNWLARRFARKSVTGQVDEPDHVSSGAGRPLAADDAAESTTRSLEELGMTSTRPSLLVGIATIARAELRELRHQPGLYLFVPLILLEIVGGSLFAVGAFGTPLLTTSGMVAAGAKNTIAVLVSLLLLFYTVESLTRERRTGVDSIIYATPLRTASLLFGKAIANAVLGAVILAGAFFGAALTILGQGKTPLEIMPFVVIWGFLLVPTFLLWSSFITLVLALVRERYTTYAVCLGALAATGYYQIQGDMTWVWNWGVWGAVPWSDMGVLELDRLPILLNRLVAVGASILFTALAVKLYGRQDPDPSRMIRRLHPWSLVRGGVRVAPYALLPVLAGGVLGYQVRHGTGGEIQEKAAKDYWRKNLSTFRDAEWPSIVALEVTLELEPAESSFHARGSYRMRNHFDNPVERIAFTAAHTWNDLSWRIDGKEIEARDSNGTHWRPSAAPGPWLEDRAGLWVFHLDPPLRPGAEIEIGFEHSGKNPQGASKNGGGAGQFILPSGVVLHIFGPSFLPVPGFFESIGVDEDNRYEPREYDDLHYRQVLPPVFGSAIPFTTRLTATAPEEYTINSVGSLLSDRVEEGRRTVVWQSDYPVKLFNVVAGKWEVKRADGTAVFFHPEHRYNVDEISEALVAAKKHYSEWFYPYPWQELKLSEFPALASYAQGFPTNITFSEGIGFLTKSDPRSNAAFMVTAHEAAHQWWGNLVTPGQGPGGNILSEGMSHYSTILLFERAKGLEQRIEFCKLIEKRYGDNRQVDAERPMVKIDGSRAGDTAVMYDKGGWVMWMLHHLMGPENALAGLREFQNRFIPGPDHPLLEDLVETLRPFAPNASSFDDFVDQWFFDVVVPEYRLSEAGSDSPSAGKWQATVKVENVGSGRMPVEIAAVSGARFAEEEGEEDAEVSRSYRESRQQVVLGPKESATLTFELDFEPQRFVVDPDALVLQLQREQARADL